jgi:hypothetical protein
MMKMIDQKRQTCNHTDEHENGSDPRISQTQTFKYPPPVLVAPPQGGYDWKDLILPSGYSHHLITPK